MTDNIKGIPFSSTDETTDPIATAKSLVVKEILNRGETDIPANVYVVWFAFILGGWKALISTTNPDGLYYEVTFNKNTDEAYVDTYAKIRNSVHHV